MEITLNFYQRVLSIENQKGADGMANNGDTDKTALLGVVDVGLHCLPDLSIRNLRMITER